MNYIDLFAGVGGLSEGFKKAGFTPIAHVELDKAACYTLKTRVAYHYLKAKKRLPEYIDYLKGFINRDELYRKIPHNVMASVINAEIAYDNSNTFEQIEGLLNKKNVDLIIGGPPCQAYSLAGRSRNRGMTNDNRNYLYVFYGRFLERYKPKVFVFENVMGLLSADKGRYITDLIASFKRIGYNVDFRILDAKNFGVLQSRKRVILIGWQKSLKRFNYPIFKEVKHSFLVGEVFRDLPSLNAGEGFDKNYNYSTSITDYLKFGYIRNGIDVLTQHVCRPHTAQDKEIYRIAVEHLQDGKRLKYTSLPLRLKTHKNDRSFFDRFKVVDDKAAFSQTIVAHISRDGHYYIHPDIQQNRSLSVREAARLQSFSDDFYFEGVKEGKNRTAAFKQIGNAVPPLMATMIAKKIKTLLNGI